jgi:CDP-diacylglycerol--glycerol-3-phosphate 3-phosphatidyltransferase
MKALGFMLDVTSINTPTILTLVRLVLSPIVMPGLIISLVPLNSPWYNILLAFVFVTLSLTDFLDGYIARSYGQETSLGCLLDPIADKFLVCSTIIALVALKKIFFYWAIIIIGREFFVMGIREIALYHGFRVHVSSFGKLKTVTQMIFLTIVMLNPAYHIKFQLTLWKIVEAFFLVSTLGLTVLSAVLYYREFVRQWKASPH